MTTVRNTTEFYLHESEKYGFTHPFNQWEFLSCDTYTCPNCESSDRDRLMWMYVMDLIQSRYRGQKIRVIEFAPTVTLSPRFRADDRISYRSCDLFVDGVDDQLDLMNLSTYEDQSVDIWICSHVLEHVDDDTKALGELRRILNLRGVGIVLVPVSLITEGVIEDRSAVTEAERWSKFGQGDHLRLYSKAGLLSRITDAGFEVEEVGKDYFGRKLLRQVGVVDSARLYVVRRNS